MRTTRFWARSLGQAMPHRKHLAIWRRHVFEVLDHGPAGGLAARIVSRALILLVLINIAAVVLESVPRYEAAYGEIFTAIEIVSLVVFTLEYALRIWTAAEHTPDGTARPL